MRAPRRLAAGLTALTGTAAGASAALAVLVIAAVFVAVLTPRASLAFRTKALQQMFTSTPAMGRSVIATIDFTTLGGAVANEPGQDIVSRSQLDLISRELAHNLTAEQVPLQPPAARWYGLTSGFTNIPGASKRAYFGTAPPQIEVLYRPDLARYSRLLRGSMPEHVFSGSAVPRFQVAVTPGVADRFALRPGSVLTIPGQAALTVTGIVRPIKTRSTFWKSDADAATATLNHTSGGHYYWLGGVFIGQPELIDLERELDASQMSLQWNFPLRLAGLSANQAVAVNRSLGNAITNGGLLTQTVSLPTSAIISCGLTDVLSEFIAADGRVGGLLALLEVSLTILGAVVLFLGGRLLAERRAAEFALMRARGAGSGQLAGLALRAGLVVVIPATAAGAAGAVALTPGGDQPAGIWFGALTALAALTGIPALAVRRAATTRADDRSDLPPGRTARARRLVADLALTLAAVGGLAVLRQQGQPPPGHTDWFTSAAPVLVAVPLAIIVVRVYPPVTKWLVRLTCRRRGVTTFVGLARAARTSLSAVLPAFALVVVLGVVAFGATLRAAVVRGDEAASWRGTGADVVIDATRSNSQLDPAVQRALAAVPGVQRSAAVGLLAGAAQDGTPLEVVVVNPDRYAALIAATPQRPFPHVLLQRGGRAGTRRIPLLVSPAAMQLIGNGGQLLIGYNTLPVRTAGRVTSMPGSAADGAFVVAPQAAITRALGRAGAQPTRMLLVGTGIDAGRLSAVVRRLLPTATVMLRSRQLAALMQAPLPHGTYVAFAQGAAAAALFGVVVLLMMLALGARSRELTLARLFTMGLSPAQARRLVLTEALPLLIGALIGGVACAWLLVPLVGPTIDLSPLTGSAVPVPVRPDYAVLAVLAGGLLVVTLITLIAQSAATRLHGLARGLRVSE
ncbi:MAG: FtsX-like permease family protein [Streptosporangiaceae bacterium]